MMENTRYKFRAWNKRTAMMEEDFYIHSNGSQYDLAERNYNTPHIEIEKVELEIMQYTGLKDKNGVEIYEGDIVEAWSQGVKAIGEVVTRIDGLFIIYPAYQSGEMWGLCPNPCGETTVKVIGNIYQNKDLLEEEK